MNTSTPTTSAFLSAPLLPLMTSLAEIQSFSPCKSGWLRILQARERICEEQGTPLHSAERFPLKDCLKSNTFGDVCWLFGKRKKEIEIVQRAARMCADSVQNLKNAGERAADADYAAYAADADYAADAAAAAVAAAAVADAAAADAAAADAADAAAYAAADAAAYAAYATADAANAAAYAAAAAADAADAADAAADAAAAAAAVADAYTDAHEKQKTLNLSFLLQCIEEYEATHQEEIAKDTQS